MLGLSALVLLSVTRVLLPGVTGLMLKPTVVPAGFPDAERFTGVVYPPMEFTPKVTEADAAPHARVVAAGLLKSNPLVIALVMVKLALEISKNIFPTASTFILAVVVGVLGMVSDSVPSLGVLAANTVGKVCPPSVDKDIFTLAQLTGEAVVFATDHAMVCEELPAHDTAVFGAVTAKGPEVLETVTTMSPKFVCPTVTGAVELYGALSLTVSLKLSVLETELNASIFVPASPPGKGPVINPPVSIVDNFGQYLIGEDAGLNDNQFGPVVLVALATLLVPEVVELSFCSQQ